MFLLVSSFLGHVGTSVSLSARAVRESPLQDPSARAPPREPRGQTGTGRRARARNGTGTADGHGHGTARARQTADGHGRQILFAGLPTKISPPPRAHTASHRTHETKTKKFPGSGSSNNGNTPQPPIHSYTSLCVFAYFVVCVLYIFSDFFI